MKTEKIVDKSSLSKSEDVKSSIRPIHQLANEYGKTDMLDGSIVYDGKRRISLSFFTSENISRAHPDVPRFSTKPFGFDSGLSYTMQTIVYGQSPEEYLAVTSAEINCDWPESIAVVRKENGSAIVEFDADFSPKGLLITQDDFNAVVRQAADDLK